MLPDVGKLAADYAQELEGLGRSMQREDIPHIRRLLGVLVHRMEADLETKVVEVEFAVPSWLGQALLQSGGVGLVDGFVCRAVNEAHPENAMILGTFRCDGEGRPVCYTCRRIKTAA